MNILLLDIETAPAEAYVWSLYDDVIPIQRLKKPGYTLSWAAKWYGEKGMMCQSLRTTSRKKMIKSIHKLLDKADAVVHYNGRRFDVPTLNRDFLRCGLTSPSPYVQIDLYPVVKKNFKLISYKLEYVCTEFNIGKKVDHRGFDMWIECMEKNEKAFKEMEEYNKGDVELLDGLYTLVRPWIANHPNVALYMDKDKHVCPVCGSTHLHSRGTKKTKVLEYRSFHCLDCGAWPRARLAKKQVNPRKNLLILP